MKMRTILSAAALCAASLMPASAATYDFGDVTNGVSLTQTLTIQTIDFIDFAFDAPSGTFVSMLDISVTSMAGSNFRPIIGLYSGTTLVANDDSGSFGGTASLSFSGGAVPADGSYTLGIGAWKSYFTANIADATSTAFFNNGSYTVSITPLVSPIPLPAGGLLLLTGIGALVLKRRKRGAA